MNFAWVDRCDKALLSFARLTAGSLFGLGPPSHHMGVYCYSIEAFPVQLEADKSVHMLFLSLTTSPY